MASISTFSVNGFGGITPPTTILLVPGIGSTNIYLQSINIHGTFYDLGGAAVYWYMYLSDVTGATVYGALAGRARPVAAANAADIDVAASSPVGPYVILTGGLPLYLAFRSVSATAAFFGGITGVYQQG